MDYGLFSSTWADESVLFFLGFAEGFPFSSLVWTVTESEEEVRSCFFLFSIALALAMMGRALLTEVSGLW